KFLSLFCKWLQLLNISYQSQIQHSADIKIATTCFCFAPVNLSTLTVKIVYRNLGRFGGFSYFCSIIYRRMTENDSLRHQGLRKRLVDGLKIKGIRDESVLTAIGKVPRHLFMESSFLNFAYKDQAFPIGAGQTISQPYTVAVQSSLLQVEKNDKILEVGTGSGYQAAVLLEMGAKVFTIERQKELFLKT